MSSIKLVLSDMDGTMVITDSHEISEAVQESIKQAEESGVIVAAVTARPYQYAKSVLTILGTSGYCVVEGGATVANLKTDEIVWKKWIDQNTLKKISGDLLQYAVEIDYFVDDKLIRAVDADVAAINWDAPYVYAKLPIGTLQDALETVARTPGVIGHAINLYEDDYAGIQVTHELADKAHGVEALCSILGIAKEATLAIGDGDNDIPLFKHAGIKVAMGNATPLLKGEADCIVASVHKDGLTEAINKYIIDK